MRRPPGTWRVVGILTRTAGRRWLNRVRSQLRWGRRKKAAGARRTGTPRKSLGGGITLVVFGGLIVFYAVSVSSQILKRLATGLESRDAQAQTRTHAENAEDEDIGLGGSPDEISRTRQWNRRAGPMFGTSLWVAPRVEPQLIRGLGLLLAGIFITLFLISIGGTNRDLGQVDWTLEWLFTLPASGRSLFLAKTFENTLIHAIGWIFNFPLLLVIFWSAGHGWLAVPLALLLTLYLNLLLAALRVVAETWLRKRLSRGRLKNVQAFCTLLGVVGMYGVLGFAVADMPSAFFRLAEAVPSALLWLPCSVPALFCSSQMSMLLPSVVLPLFALAIPLWAIRSSERLVSDGLISGSASDRGRRGVQVSPGAAGGLFRGIVAKELHLLLRDRTLLVQTLVVPLLILGFQVLWNPAIFSDLGSNPRTVATIAFGVGAYVLMFGSFTVLTVEGDALWLLYTLPQPLDVTLRGKAKLWASLSASYTLLILLIALFSGSRPAPADLLTWVMALAGIYIFALLGTGLATLGTDPLEKERNRKVRPGMLYLYMFLAGMYGTVMHNPEPWPKFVLMILCPLLAYAVWQKVRDRIPYLLDPTQRPKPQLSLSDGLVAAVSFFVLQTLILLGLSQESDLPLGTALLYAYCIAGVIVGVICFAVLALKRIPRLAVTLGLVRDPDLEARPSLLKWGLMGGALAGAIGALYLWGSDYVGFLRAAKDRASLARELLGDQLLVLSILVLVAAPFFEEFIFRGLIFRGLRRSNGVWASALGSAAIFAIVHPPYSFVPVFAVGLITAFVFERTRMLWAPILVHMIYNGAVILMG